MSSEATRLWAAESELNRIHNHAKPLVERWRQHVGEPEAMADLGLILRWAAEEIKRLDEATAEQCTSA